MELPAESELSQRLEVVHEVLYLMFNEGYSTSAGELALRTDLCEEAARLCHLLCESKLGRPTTFGLLALMLFHAARFDARLDEQGVPILLRDQDRARWDQSMIRVADYWLHKSGDGNEVSRYHLEAVVSRIHCVAETYQETDWGKIVTVYEMMQARYPSPMNVLNQAIALGQLGQHAEAIQNLDALKQLPQMKVYPLLWCSLAELYQAAGQAQASVEHWEKALQLTQGLSDRELIQSRLDNSQE